MEDAKTLKIPEVGEYVRGLGVLVKIEEVAPPPPPPPPEVDYIFEQIESRKELRLNGELLKKGDTYWDFYGQAKSVESAIQEQFEWCHENGITAESQLEAVVVKIVSQYRARPAKRSNDYNRDFFAFEKHGSYLRGLPDPVETVVWSSKRDLVPKYAEGAGR